MCIKITLNWFHEAKLILLKHLFYLRFANSPFCAKTYCVLFIVTSSQLTSFRASFEAAQNCDVQFQTTDIHLSVNKWVNISYKSRPRLAYYWDINNIWSVQSSCKVQSLHTLNRPYVVHILICICLRLIS